MKWPAVVQEDTISEVHRFDAGSVGRQLYLRVSWVELAVGFSYEA